MSKANKILVLGIDGMDPRLTQKYLDEGIMPNVQRLINRGSHHKSLWMLGGQPTVTPPMWTSLSTGAFPCTHGITSFWNQGPELDEMAYNMDSRMCKAEQLWNVFTEAGKKTLVWHWPGCSWPPTSDNPNLHVVDGTQPCGVNCGDSVRDSEFILIASKNVQKAHFRYKAATDSHVPCVINDLDTDHPSEGPDNGKIDQASYIDKPDFKMFIMSKLDGEYGLSEAPFDVAYAPIKEPINWTDAPEGAKESTMLLSGGLINRPILILKNEQGIYDRVAIYKNNRSTDPLIILKKDIFTTGIVDDAVKNDVMYQVSRNMRLLEIDENGESFRMWVSGGMDIHKDTLWHPKELFQQVTDNVGYPVPESILGGSDIRLIRECSAANWTAAADWTANALHYLIEANNYEVVFSHFHNVDMQGHMIVKFLKGNPSPTVNITKEDYRQLMREVYIQTDDYVGRFLHFLDEGWTIFLVSDHGQVCAEHHPPLIGETMGVSVKVMEELGYTTMKKDEQGNDLREIDWEKTKAVAIRANHIYLNLKGRGSHGIVDPADQYELEEEIMTALYNYHDPETNRRVIALAVRNKDAYVFGMGGPECGDIVIFLAEGYNNDHSDSLSTTLGVADTSVSPIFVAAGPGIKENYSTERIIRIVDVTPTIASIMNVRMPAQCEGAPVYQILTE